jgi:hypothetical protein
MSKAKNRSLRAEYRREDLGRGVRGKYFASFQEGSNLVLLNPEIAKAFPTAEAVNEALRGLLVLAKRTSRPTRRSRRNGKKTSAA